MKIRSVDFDDEGEPEKVRVELTTAEAALVAKLVGRLNHTEGEEVMRGGGEAVVSLYEGLVGCYFNVYYDGGVDDYLRGRSG